MRDQSNITEDHSAFFEKHHDLIDKALEGSGPIMRDIKMVTMTVSLNIAHSDDPTTGIYLRRAKARLLKVLRRRAKSPFTYFKTIGDA